MLKVRICTADGAVLAEGTCSDSGYFPPALSSIYNAGLKLEPARSVQTYESSSELDDYPVGTRRVRFGYTLPRERGADHILDDEVVVHVERT